MKPRRILAAALFTTAALTTLTGCAGEEPGVAPATEVQTAREWLTAVLNGADATSFSAYLHPDTGAIIPGEQLPETCMTVERRMLTTAGFDQAATVNYTHDGSPVVEFGTTRGERETRQAAESGGSFRVLLRPPLACDQLVRNGT